MLSVDALSLPSSSLSSSLYPTISPLVLGGDSFGYTFSSSVGVDEPVAAISWNTAAATVSVVVGGGGGRVFSWATDSTDVFRGGIFFSSCGLTSEESLMISSINSCIFQFFDDGGLIDSFNTFCDLFWSAANKSSESSNNRFLWTTYGLLLLVLLPPLTISSTNF